MRSFISDYGAEQFIETGNTIKSVIEAENILLSKGATKFGLGDHFTNLGEQINSSLGMILLEVTERCNLRCSYCIYNPQVESTRNHGQKDMDLKVAYQAIDYLKKSSSKKKEVAITFYGGEPLLRFPFIKSCVEYARKTVTDKSVKFSVTTNGVLMTQEIAQFFASNEFSVLVSLDGPEEIHDRYRKDANGKGSFKNTIDALKNLIDAFGDKSKSKIGISMVYAPPHNERSIQSAIKIFDQYPWLPKEMRLNITYPHPGSMSMESLSKTDFEEVETLFEWSKNQFLDNYDHKKNLHPVSRNIIEKEMAQFIQRPTYQKPIDEYYLNGCCVPGVRKVYVTVDGSILLCEKTYYDTPRLGNIFSGIDIDAVEKVLIDDYGKNSLPLCSKCWAIRLCNQCYIYSFQSGKFNSAKKQYYCHITRFSKEKVLTAYCDCMEKNVNSLDYLRTYELS